MSINSIVSSYNKNNLNFGDIISFLSWLIKPNLIVEFGILHGYSLINFANKCPNAQIDAYDIFEQFNGNSAKRSIIDKFIDYKNVNINEGDFYKMFHSYEDQSIDILHIDIANDGHTYEFALNHYTNKLSSTGIMILEGGSEERDNVEWMHKYSKIPIESVLNKYKDQYDIFVFDAFPSMTIVRRKI